MTPKRKTVVQALAVFALAGASAMIAWLGPTWAFLAPGVTWASWYVGKLLGVPIPSVTQDAVRRMEPWLQVKLTVGAVQSLPAPAAEAVASEVISKLATAPLTRSILDSIPPAAKQDVLDRIVFLSSHPPEAGASTPPTTDKGTDDHGQKEEG